MERMSLLDKARLITRWAEVAVGVSLKPDRVCGPQEEEDAEMESYLVPGSEKPLTLIKIILTCLTTRPTMGGRAFEGRISYSYALQKLRMWKVFK